MKPIFFDYASTTPVDPRVASRMLEFMTSDGLFANASSKHLLGLEVEEELILAKSKLAKAINSDINELIWTSGATESINMALKSFVGAGIITSKIEHKATLETCKYLADLGKQVILARAEKFTGEVEASILLTLKDHPEISLLTISLVNNELGNIIDIKSLIAEARRISPSILIHVDASQALGKISIDVREIDCDMMSFSAHKLYGPKGIGALYIKQSLKYQLTPLIHGGGQEYGLRSGTYANHQIIGFGEAVQIASAEMELNQAKISLLSKMFTDILVNEKINFHINRAKLHLPNILSLTLPVDSETLLAAMPEFAASTGSACSGDNIEISHVLSEILPRKDALNTIRVSFGKYLNEKDVDITAPQLCRLVRSLS